MYRIANPADYDALGQVMFDAIHAAPSPYSRTQRRAWAPTAPSGERWHTKLAKQFVVLFEDTAGPQGFLTLSAEGELDLAFLRRQIRGQGHLGALFDMICKEAEIKGINRLLTYASLSAQGPFSTLGFVVVQHKTVSIRGVTLRHAKMAFDLPAPGTAA